MFSAARVGAVAEVLGQLLRAEVGRWRRGVGTGADASGRAQQRAVDVRRSLERLGPFFIKVGQILSTRPDIVSDALIVELEKLHDQVSPTRFASFEPVLSAELGPGWRRQFRDVDTSAPLGAASLAQVYRADLHDGTPAVVKIQRPGIKAIVHSDMAMLRSAARLAMRCAPRFSAVVDVEAMLRIIFDAMRPELDFRIEARNMERAAGAVEDFKTLSVPAVLLATPRVLVQSLAPGTSIRHAKRDDFTVGERMAIGRDMLGLMYRGYFVDRMFHADPHPGNVFVQPGGPASLIDWGMVGRVDRRTSLLILLILLTLAQNDGYGLAKAWTELGHATPWADLPGFANDMAALVPRIATASLEDLNFGVTLTAVLERSTRRGIQTSPVISLLGKSFSNMEGSVRHLAPELSLVEVFEEAMYGILVELARESVSLKQNARNAVELMLGSASATEQIRTVLRDLADRQLTIQTGWSRDSGRAYRAAVALAAVAAWLGYLHRNRINRSQHHRA